MNERKLIDWAKPLEVAHQSYRNCYTVEYKFSLPNPPDQFKHVVVVTEKNAYTWLYVLDDYGGSKVDPTFIRNIPVVFKDDRLAVYRKNKWGKWEYYKDIDPNDTYEVEYQRTTHKVVPYTLEFTL